MSSPKQEPAKAAGPPGAAEQPAPPQSQQDNQQPPSQQPPSQQPTSGTTTSQQAVNFKGSSAPANAGAYNTRRVTIGHGGNQQQQGQPQQQPPPPGSFPAPGLDRRGSLASTNFNMDDFFGRRMSMGFNMDVDDLFARRNSMDSTAAALDAAMMDLNRRRFSMAMGGGVPPTAGDISLGSPDAASRTLSMGLGGLPPPPFGNPMPMGNPAGGPPQQQSAAVNNITARQQQLQDQQRELERRQKELEMQRRQLIANMQDRGGAQPMLPPASHPPGGYQGSDSLGLGSLHSAGSYISAPTSMAHRPSNTSGPNQQWWVCQICNSKAFNSREEAMTHEQTCTAGHPPMQGGSMMGGVASRNFSLGMNSLHSAHTDHSGGSYDMPNMSSGPFAHMEHPMPLSMDSDKDWLTPLHCFVRAHCVEVFTATEADVATPSKGKRKPIHVGQIGIRCPHCHRDDPSASKSRERGSVYYPTTISSVYNATMNLLQRHLHNCASVPTDVMHRYETLKADDARSGTSKRYWVESALSLGMVDTPQGIRFSALQPPPLPAVDRQQESTANDSGRRNSNDLFSSKSNAPDDATLATEASKTDATEASAPKDAAAAEKTAAGGPAVSVADQQASSAPLVAPEDKPYATGFSHHLLGQMQACVFTEADRLGKRKGLPPGFPGLACRHCFGGYGSGRFFPSSIKTLSDTSKTLNVLHNHMMRCRKCPEEVRTELAELRKTHDEERAKMKFGSQKAFFARIWERLHGKGAPGAVKRAKPAPSVPPQSPPAGYRQMAPGMHPGMGYGPPQSMPPMHMDQQMHHQMQMQQQQQQMPPQTGGLDTLARHAPTPPDAKRQKTSSA